MNRVRINRIAGGRTGSGGADRRTLRALYLPAFLLPLVMAALICIRNEVYPFGDNCILHIDMYHQYEPFFTELMDKLKNGGSLLYSFRIGLGSDFVSLIAYYLASPLNLFLIVCPAEHVIEFMTLLILLKIGLCGLTFAVYLKGHFGGAERVGAVFAAFYALSGYMAAYSWDIMWLDCLVLAPLVILGLERLVKEKSCGLYCLSLGMAIITNFYIAIMICIFAVLYYVLLFFEEVRGIRERLSCLFRFALYSLLAGGMGAVLIFPAAVILSYSGSSDLSFDGTVEWYFDLISMLARHCMDVEVYTGREHWPNLYCGSAVFLFLTLYFCNRKISWKKKAGRGALVIFFWLSFSNNLLDFIWHGLHFPDSLPGRQSFLYIFLLLTLSYEAYQNREGNRIRDAVLAAVISFGFLGLSAVIVDTGMVTADSILMTAVLIGGYVMLFVMWKLQGREGKRLAVLLSALLAALELFVNFSTTGLSVTSRSSYTGNWESVKGLLKQVEQMETDPFYRVEEMERLTKNDAAVYGYSSSTIFSSLMNINISSFYRKAGMEGGKNFYSCSGATPLLSAMLSVKYLISKSPYEGNPLRTLVAEDGQNYIYRSLYTLPLGFMVDDELEARWSPGAGVPVSNLNRLANALGVSGELLQPYLGETFVGDEETIVTPEEDGYLYAVYSDKSVTNITVTNGERVRRFNKCDHGYILELGWCRAGDEVKITNTSDVSNFQVQVYSLDTDVLAKAYDVLSRQTLRVDSFTDTKIKGYIEVSDAGKLVLSIPREAGWSVWVDGKKTESSAFMECMLEVPLAEGEHEIMLTYRTPGLLPGAAVSASSLLLFIILQIRRKRKKNESKRIYRRLSAEIQ